MSLVSEFLQYVGLVRNETQNEGNTKERVADTFMKLYDLDIWFRKLPPEDPQATHLLQADGTRIQIRDQNGLILENILPPLGIAFDASPSWNDLPTEPRNGDVFNMTANTLPVPENVVPIDPAEPGGLYIWDGENWQGRSNALLYEEVLAMLGGKANVRLDNVASDLSGAEQDEIHTKLQIENLKRLIVPSMLTNIDANIYYTGEQNEVITINENGIRIDFGGVVNNNLLACFPTVQRYENYPAGDYYINIECDDSSVSQNLDFYAFDQYISFDEVAAYKAMIIEEGQTTADTIFPNLAGKTEGVDYNIPVLMPKQLISWYSPGQGEHNFKAYKITHPSGGQWIGIKFPNNSYYAEVDFIMMRDKPINSYVGTTSNQWYPIVEKFTYYKEGNYYKFWTGTGGSSFPVSYNDLTDKPDLSALDNFDTFEDLVSFPATGASDILYIANDTGLAYRWNGTAYVQITSAPPDLSNYYTKSEADAEFVPATAPAAGITAQDIADWSGKEDALGNPANSGDVLISDTAGNRSWATVAGVEPKMTKVYEDRSDIFALDTYYDSFPSMWLRPFEGKVNKIEFNASYFTSTPNLITFHVGYIPANHATPIVLSTMFTELATFTIFKQNLASVNEYTTLKFPTVTIPPNSKFVIYADEAIRQGMYTTTKGGDQFAIHFKSNTNGNYYASPGKWSNGIRLFHGVEDRMLEGTDVLVLGDSITEVGGSWAWKAREAHGFNMVNVAKSGALISDRFTGATNNTAINLSESPGANDNVISNQVFRIAQYITPLDEQITWTHPYTNETVTVPTEKGLGLGYTFNPKLIIINAGTNDSHVLQTGEEVDAVMGHAYLNLTRNGIPSALRWAIISLEILFPDAQIMVGTPMVRKNAPTTRVKADHILNLSRAMSFMTADQYTELGIIDSMEVASAGGRYLHDGLHPNNVGKVLQGNFWINKIRNNYIPRS